MKCSAANPSLSLRARDLLAGGLVALALGSAGCAPALLWYGHDPTRTTRFELRARGDHTWLETAHEKSPAFDQVHVADLVFSPRGDRFAVPVRRGASWAMLIDGKESAFFDSVEPAVFSADGRHVAFAGVRRESTARGREEDGWHVVLDGTTGPAVESLTAGTLAFTASGARFGYAARQGGCTRVFTNDGPPRGCYRRVKSLFLGDNASRDAALLEAPGETPRLEQPLERVAAPLAGLSALAVAASTSASTPASASAGDWAALLREDGHVRIVRSGATLAVVEDADELTFSPRGELAWAEKKDGTWQVVLEGRREPAFAWIRGIAFSPSGARHGYRAGAIVAPGAHAGNDTAIVVDGRELARAPFADGLVFSPDERRVAFALRESAAASWLVCDGQRFAFDVLWENSIAFSRDGQHFGAVVGDRGKRRLAITLDGKSELPFDSEELFGAAAQGAARLEGLRGWVVAELERPRKGSP